MCHVVVTGVGSLGAWQNDNAHGNLQMPGCRLLQQFRCSPCLQQPRTRRVDRAAGDCPWRQLLWHIMTGLGDAPCIDNPKGRGVRMRANENHDTPRLHVPPYVSRAVKLSPTSPALLLHMCQTCVRDDTRARARSCNHRSWSFNPSERNATRKPCIRFCMVLLLRPPAFCMCVRKLDKHTGWHDASPNGVCTTEPVNVSPRMTGACHERVHVPSNGCKHGWCVHVGMHTYIRQPTSPSDLHAGQAGRWQCPACHIIIACGCAAATNTMIPAGGRSHLRHGHHPAMCLHGSRTP